MTCPGPTPETPKPTGRRRMSDNSTVDACSSYGSPEGDAGSAAHGAACVALISGNSSACGARFAGATRLQVWADAADVAGMAGMADMQCP
jgi:hypothetical protein